MLWLELIAGVLMFGAGVVLLARVGARSSRPNSPETRPSSSQRPWARRRRQRSFEDEFAELTEQLRKND